MFPLAACRGGKGSSPTAAGPVTLLHDTFTDADSTDLASHTMDIGPGWTPASVTQAMTVQGNKAKSTSNNTTIYVAESGASDVTITANLTWS